MWHSQARDRVQATVGTYTALLGQGLKLCPGTDPIVAWWELLTLNLLSRWIPSNYNTTWTGTWNCLSHAPDTTLGASQMLTHSSHRDSVL